MSYHAATQTAPEFGMITLHCMLGGSTETVTVMNPKGIGPVQSSAA